MTVYVKDGKLNYEYNLFLMEHTHIQSEKVLPEGEVTIEVESKATKPGPFTPFDITIKVNGEAFASGVVPKTAPSFFSFNDGFDIGSDLGSPVSQAYYDDMPFKFDGKIKEVRVKYLEQ